MGPGGAEERAELAVAGQSVTLSLKGHALVGKRESPLSSALHLPMHFCGAATNLLTNPGLDPYAKIAESKVSAVRIEKAVNSLSGGTA